MTQSERSDFPFICKSCLGDNPNVIMTKADNDKACRICTKPFTVSRWRPDQYTRCKKTEICQTCSKSKNVCQVCLLDLLPVQVPDTALSIKSNDAIPKSDVNGDLRARVRIDYEPWSGKVRVNDTIMRLQRTTPHYMSNIGRICSLFVRGQCKRGPECPYIHEMPEIGESETGESEESETEDLYYGVKYPDALKLLNKAGEMPTLEPPEDESIRTLYVGGVHARISEQDLRDNFYAHGEIESVKRVPQRACAFVTYTTREGAEKAAEELSNRLVIKGFRMQLLWGRPRAEPWNRSIKIGRFLPGFLIGSTALVILCVFLACEYLCSSSE